MYPARRPLAESNSRLERIALGFVLLLAATLAAVGIGYSLPRHYDPAPDAIHPAIALDAFEHVFSERHVAGIKYPRLHLVVSGAAQRAWLFARHGTEGAAIADRLVATLRAPADGGGMLGWRDRFRPFRGVLTELILVGRALSALAFVLLVYATFRFARQLLGPTESFLAAFATALCYPLVYYAHTLNVDVPYLCLGMFALGFAVRAANEGSGSRLVLAAGFAALAMATKDQAYAWFVLVIPWVIVRWMRPRGAPRPFPWGPATLAFVVSLAVYALAIGWPFDASGVRAHFEHITGAGSEAYRIYEKSIAGQLDLLHEVFLHLRDSLGLPLLGFAALGFVRLWLRDRSTFALLVLGAVSYHLTFLAVIRYCYQRFTLPVALLLFVAAAAGIGWLFSHRQGRFAAMLLSVVLLGERAQRAIEVDAMLLDDPQGRAAAYLEATIQDGAEVAAALELPLSNVELPEHAKVRLLSPGEDLRLAAGESRPRYLVFSLYDPMRTAFTPRPAAATVPETARVFGAEYVRIAVFAPTMVHALRFGAAFQPTIGVYEAKP